MRRIIQEEHAEEGGYWIVLKPGWKLQDEDTHCITEDTRRAARAKLADVVPCKCAECKAEKETTR